MSRMPRVLDNFELVNHLMAVCQGWSVARRLRNVCGDRDSDGAAAVHPDTALVQIRQWGAELRAGDPLVLNNSAQHPSARLEQALALLQVLVRVLGAAADTHEDLVQHASALLDRVGAVGLVAGRLQQAARDLHLLRAKLSYARAHGQGLVLEQLRRQRPALTVRLAEARQLRRRLAGPWPGDGRESVVLSLSSAAVPGALRLQAVDLRCLHAQVMQHPSPEVLGVDSRSLAAWRERKLNAYVAAAWQALGLSVESALSWQPWSPADANEWHSRGFLPADAFAWQAHGFAATEAAVYRAFGVPTAEQAQVQREVLGNLDTFVAWCRAGVDPREMVGWRLAGAIDPAEVPALRARGAQPVPYQVVSIGGKVQVHGKTPA